MSDLDSNSYQVGGDHYKASYQHWDFAIEVPLSYLEAATTKYVVRHPKKGGVEDLKKALHYLNKLVEVAFRQSRAMPYAETLASVQMFSRANALGALERRYVEILSTWEDVAELEYARELLLYMITFAETGFSKPVPLTEENHYAERAEQDPLGR